MHLGRRFSGPYILQKDFQTHEDRKKIFRPMYPVSIFYDRYILSISLFYTKYILKIFFSYSWYNLKIVLQYVFRVHVFCKKLICLVHLVKS